jgi:capsular polysaccharide transport system permease protein
LLQLLRVQIQVIGALILRNIQSAQANLAYGFGWVFFDAVLGFAGLLIMKLAIRGYGGIPGVPTVTFLVSGLIPWLMFSSIYHIPDGAIKRGKTLLLLPMVTELDLVLAASFFTFMVYTILFVVLAVCAAIYDGYGFPRFPMGIVLLFFSMGIMGMALGLILMILTRLYAPAGKFVGFFMRFSMIISGVIFQITMFPATIWPYLAWNPLLHVEELLRTYWFYSYRTPIGSPTYVIECMLGMMFFGLLIERYVRRRLPPT